jgi:CHAT domain-containing protein
MTRIHVFNVAMNTALRSVLLAFGLSLMAVPRASRGQEKPKPDRATLDASFQKAEDERKNAKENTKERAEAAKNAMQIASDIAWSAFDAGKFDEAATWFATSAKLKEESYLNARRYWEEYHRTTAIELDNKVDDQIKVQQAQLATADDSKKPIIHKLIHGWEKLRYLNRYNAVTMLENVARDNYDAENLLKYYEEELAIRQAEMAYLKKVSAPEEEIDEKNAQLATALERVASGEGDLAMFEKAEKHGLEALALRQALPPEMAERKLDESLSSLARMYAFNIGDLKTAKKYFEEALLAIESSAAVRRKALEEDKYYSADDKAKMTKEELAKHEQSQAQTRDMTIAIDAMSQAMALMNLAEISYEEGDLKTAISQAQRALKVAEDLPKGGYLNVFEMFRARVRGRVMGDMAAFHADGGEIDLALKELDQTIAIKREIGQDDWTAQSVLQAADLAYQKGDLASARRFVEQARQIFAAAHKLTSVVNATGFLAVIARDEEKLDEAAKHADEALTLARKSGNLGAVSGSARTFASIRVKQNKLDEAKALIEEAQDADAKTGSLNDRIGTLGITGEIMEAGGDNEKALAVYKEAVKLVEGVRATAASETSFADVKKNYRPYERIVRTLIKLNRPDEAFDYLSRAKSKKLQDSLRLSSVKGGDKNMQALLERANGLESKLQATNAQLQAEQTKPEADRDKAKIENLKKVVATTNGEFRKVFEEIKTSNPNYEKFLTVNPMQLKETQEDIPPGVMLVQYAPLGEQLYIFLVSQENVKVLIAPTKPDELWKKIKTLRKQITSGESGAPLTKNLTALYDALIAPIESELEPIKVVAFIPNQLLFYLPMQALAKKQPDGSMRYLIEDKQIVYLASADVMKVMLPPSAKKAADGMVAFGNPTGANLPAAEKEVKAIAEVFPSTEVLSGPEVTKVALNTETHLNKKIMHFATHGMLNASKPSDSYIQLAAAPDETQAHLTVAEVWDLPLKKVSLVTLSACESALGDKEPDGGEITTLAEAFASAGARTVLASLWSVGDESTKELMVEFYSKLASGMSKAEALQAAEIKMLRNPKFSRPLYWAPFVLMGDWR